VKSGPQEKTKRGWRGKVASTGAHGAGLKKEKSTGLKTRHYKRSGGEPKRGRGAKTEQQLCGVGRVRELRNWKEGTIREKEGAVLGDRRKFGVARGWPMSTVKNSLKILLTENGYWNDTPFAPVSAFPRTIVPAFLPIRTPEIQSARSTGVCTIRERNDAFVRNGSGSHSL
jgi:hypothetical protein